MHLIQAEWKIVDTLAESGRAQAQLAQVRLADLAPNVPRGVRATGKRILIHCRKLI